MVKNTISKTIKEKIKEKSNDYTQKQYPDITGALRFPDFTPLNKAVKPLTATIVIPAYNVSKSIIACLASIEQSSFNLNYQNRLQVIVIDDGSTDGTWEKIARCEFSMHLMALKQTHHGQAQALNTGISAAEGDIIISCDADMLLSYYTIEQLVVRHQQLDEVLLVGFRSDVSNGGSDANPSLIRENENLQRVDSFLKDDRIHFSIPGWPSNMCLSSEHFKNLGYGRGLWMPDDGEPWILPDLVFGALFSLPRSVYFRLGGYDERFLGWGCTDSFLAAKAIASGNYIIPVYTASGLHISHPPRSKNKEAEYKRNRKLYHHLLRTIQIDNYGDWLNSAKNRIIESFTKTPFSQTPKLTNSHDDAKTITWKSEIDGLLALGEYSRAFNRLMDLKISRNEHYYLRLGKTLFGMNRFNESINIFKQASAITKLKADFLLNLAIAQAANSQFSSSHLTLKNLSQNFPELSELSYWYKRTAEKHIRQGNYFFDQGNLRVARRCFEAALMLEPKNKTALSLREKCAVS